MTFGLSHDKNMRSNKQDYYVGEEEVQPGTEKTIQAFCVQGEKRTVIMA